MRNDVIHIYYGTQGNGGLYLDEIYQALKQNGFKQQVFVSYYYPFNYGKRIFFKYTDLISGISNSRFRYFLRAMEICNAYFYIILYLLFNKPKAVNFSLNSARRLDYVFIWIIQKMLCINTVITAHDVLPLVNSQSKSEAIALRRKIFQVAKYILVHNKKSIEDLTRIFNINEKNILIHPFPYMDLKKVFVPFYKVKRFDFVFLGHIRKEKGIDLLLDSWRFFHEIYPSATLLIAGNCSNKAILDTELCAKLNISLKVGYLSDSEYVSSLYQSKCLILPYIEGTNSGVVFTALSTNINIICSDLEMFKSNNLLDKASFFKSENVDELIKCLVYEYNSKYSEAVYQIDNYRILFLRDVMKVYKDILNDSLGTN